MLLHQITTVLSRSGWRPEKPESPSKASVRHLLFQAFPSRSAFLSQPFVTASGPCWLLPCFPTLAPFIAFPSCPPPALVPQCWDSDGTKPGDAHGRCSGCSPTAVCMGCSAAPYSHILSIRTGIFLGDRNENLLPPSQFSVLSGIYFYFIFLTPCLLQANHKGTLGACFFIF